MAKVHQSMSASRKFSRFLLSSSGNIAAMAALMIPPIVLAMGAGLDYIAAAGREERLNGIADAAALAAVTPAMMLQDDTTATTTAMNLFNSQSSVIGSIGTVTPTINIVDTVTATNIIRTATVSYRSTSHNVFAGVIGMPTMGITGISVAKSSLSPRTNFYLMIDTSPSMEIPSTTAGINTMVSNTTAGQGGCAFACHETDTNAATDDGLYNPANIVCTGAENGATNTYGYSNVNPSFPTVGTHSSIAYGAEDNYALARCLDITMRIDLVNAAVQNLMTTAPATATANNTVYKIALYTIDLALNQLYPVNTSNPVTGPPISPAQLAPDANFTAAQAAAGTISPLTIYKNNNPTSSYGNSDEDSWLDMGLQQLNSIMPDPGNGSSTPGDTPKEVLFIISDALGDYDNGGRVYPPIDSTTNWCSTIKNRKIRIAVLYLTYNPLPPTSADAWYTTYISPVQANIGPAALACASPGLYFEVDTNGDINGALQALFQKTVATAYLSM
jgi:Flp pilus assembly protein TadG